MVLQEKLNFLLDKYDVHKKVVLKNNSMMIEDVEIPLLPWRNKRKFTELKSIIHDGTLFGVSVLRSCRITEKGTDTNTLLYREFDLCEWLLQSRICEIMTFKNKSTANSVVKMENGVVCTIEVAATLAEGAIPIDKHEVTSQRGVASDMVVDTQAPQQSVYVYTNNKNPITYTDVDFELFGLSMEETSIVRQAFEVAKNPKLANELQVSANRLASLIVLSEKSATQLCNVAVGVGK